jgi:predicted MFS family arabinose efflux permease
MSLFRNRIFTVAALVTFISGIAMMGSFFYIPLFVQGVLGASATNSGMVLMPMMIAMAIASSISGQIMSRLGRYRVQGIVGLSLMVVAAYMLSRLNVDSSRMDVVYAMVIFGIGLGTSMPLFMLAVQNAVPYRFMGISTSTMQFLRSVGGTFGVAIMFSFIQRGYHDALAQTVPAPVHDHPEIETVLDDPQFVLNENALDRVREGFAVFGEQSEALFAETIGGVKEALAIGISDAFMISVFVLVVALVISFFMEEIPLRKAHYEGEEQESAGSLPEAAVALPPVAGGANGHDEPSRLPGPHASGPS